MNPHQNIIDLLIVLTTLLLVSCSNVNDPLPKTELSFIVQLDIEHGKYSHLVETDSYYFVSGYQEQMNPDSNKALLVWVNKNGYFINSRFFNGEVINSIKEYQDKLFLVSGDSLYCLNGNGEEIWQTLIPFKLFDNSIIADNIHVSQEGLNLAVSVFVDSLSDYVPSVIKYDFTGNFVERVSLSISNIFNQIVYADNLGDNIFLHDYNFYFYLLQMDGSLIWKEAVNYIIPNNEVSYQITTIANDLVYFASNSGIVTISSGFTPNIFYDPDSTSTLIINSTRQGNLIVGEDFFNGLHTPIFTLLTKDQEIIFQKQYNFITKTVFTRIDETSDGGFLLLFNGLLIKTDANGDIGQTVLESYINSLKK